MSDRSESRTVNSVPKSALITGASKGIGFAVARALIQQGYAVTMTSRNEEEVKAAATELTEFVELEGQQVRGVRCDVRDAKAVEQLVTEHVEVFGNLDVLFVNAGIGKFASVEELSIEDWQDVIEINLNGAFYTIKAAIPALKQRGGYIFTLSSLAGRNTFARGAAYNASKFGLNALSEVANLDLRPYDIKVTQIMPGSVATHFNGRAPTEDDAWKIQPEDIAKLTVDLLNMPTRTLPSRVEVRPSRPDRKPA